MIRRAARANATGSGLDWWKFSANCIVSASRREMPSTTVKRQFVALALGLVEQLHRPEPPAPGEQLVRHVGVAGLADERRVQQARSP